MSPPDDARYTDAAENSWGRDENSLDTISQRVNRLAL
jgi:hypothetical protein